MITWHPIAEVTLTSLPENEMKLISVAEKQIILLKRGEQVYAFTARCPHAGAPLCDGWLDAQGRIVCPDHKYRFDPANGRNTSGEGYKLFTYPTQINDNIISIGILS
jgi:3-phenylpropionate/trans-cinnamate dioxygenase ferredoxin subunit